MSSPFQVKKIASVYPSASASMFWSVTAVQHAEENKHLQLTLGRLFPNLGSLRFQFEVRLNTRSLATVSLRNSVADRLTRPRPTTLPFDLPVLQMRARRSLPNKKLRLFAKKPKLLPIQMLERRVSIA